MRRLLVVASIVGLGSPFACAGVPEQFVCQRDAECVDDELAGKCEANHGCSLPDEACPTGRRYVHESTLLADQCVEPWIVVVGGPLAESDPVLAIDRRNLLHLGATFFDRTEVDQTSLVSAGSSDFFLATIDAPTGRIDAVERFGGAGEDELAAVVRASDGVVVTASFDAPIEIDGATLDGPGFFVARRGDRPWVHATTSRAGYAYPAAVAEDGSSGGVVVVGGVASLDAAPADIDFGTSAGGEALALVTPSKITTENEEQGFVATYDADGRVVAVASVRDDATSGTCEAVAVDTSGVFVAGCEAFDPGDTARDEAFTLLHGSAAWFFPDVLSEHVSSESTGVPALAAGGGSGFLLATSCENACDLPPDSATPIQLVTGPSALVVARVSVAEANDFDPVTEWHAVLDPPGVELYPEAIAVAPDGKVYVVGGFVGASSEITSGGRTDAFVATFGASGTFEKIEAFGGAGDDWADAVVVGDDGKVYVAGTFQGAVTFRGRAFDAGDNVDVFVMLL